MVAVFGFMATTAEPNSEVNAIGLCHFTLVGVGAGDVGIPSRVQLAHLLISGFGLAF